MSAANLQDTHSSVTYLNGKILRLDNY